MPSAVANVAADATIANPPRAPEETDDQSGREEAELRAKLEELRAQWLAGADELTGLGPVLIELQAMTVADPVAAMPSRANQVAARSFIGSPLGTRCAGLATPTN